MAEEKDAVAARKQVDTALKSFTCFLYVGKSTAYYKARPWNDDDFHSQGERMKTLEILAACKKTELVPITKIKIAMDSGLTRRPETLMFALAMCARQKRSEKLRAAAYYFLVEHCKKWEYFILFIKYASELCKLQGSGNKDTDEKDEGQRVEPKKDEDEIEEEKKAENKTNEDEQVEEQKNDKKPIGWGRGWKNAVNKWYFTKDVHSLVELVTRHKGGHGWTHRDIFKLSHPELCGLEVEKQAIVSYVMNGRASAEKEFDSDPEAKRVLRGIRVIEELKNCRGNEAAQLIADHHHLHQLTIDYVHPMALKHKEVWLVLLEFMDVRTILKYLPKLHEWGFLSRDSPAIPLIVKSLTNEYNLRWNKVLPHEILTVLNIGKFNEISVIDSLTNLLYGSVSTEASRRLLESVIAEKTILEQERNATADKPRSAIRGKGASTVVKGKKKDKSVIETETPDKRIRDALRAALKITQTVDITGSSKRKYLISADLPGRCTRRGKKDECARAGLALALPLLHRVDLPEDAVTIVGYAPAVGGGKQIPINEDTSFDKSLELFQTARRHDSILEGMPLGALGWAYRAEKSYDVFIKITNDPPAKACRDYVLYHVYKNEKNLPDTRFINVIIHRAALKLPIEAWKDSLIINGFDSHVPWIIEAYVRGLF